MSYWRVTTILEENFRGKVLIEPRWTFCPQSKTYLHLHRWTTGTRALSSTVAKNSTLFSRRHKSMLDWKHQNSVCIHEHNDQMEYFSLWEVNVKLYQPYSWHTEEGKIFIIKERQIKAFLEILKGNVVLSFKIPFKKIKLFK